MRQPSSETEEPTQSFLVRMRYEMKRQMGSVPTSGEWVAYNTLVGMTLLLIQFGIGMGVNLKVSIPAHHPGVGASNFFSGVFDSVRWAIVHGPLALAIHVAFGMAIVVMGTTHGLFWNLKWGTTGTVWTTGIAGAFLLGAGLSGGAFLTYNSDVYSLLMALFFGAALLCYAIDIFLFLRSPEVGRSLRCERPRR